MARRRRQQVNIRRILELYGKVAADAARQALRENAENLAQTARELCPVEKDEYNGRHYKLKHPGRLRDSIHVEEGKNNMRIVADAVDEKGRYYGMLIEYSPRSQAFMEPAYREKKIEMINHSQDKIRNAIRAVNLKK